MTVPSSYFVQIKWDVRAEHSVWCLARGTNSTLLPCAPSSGPANASPPSLTVRPNCPGSSTTFPGSVSRTSVSHSHEVHPLCCTASLGDPAPPIWALPDSLGQGLGTVFICLKWLYFKWLLKNYMPNILDFVSFQGPRILSRILCFGPSSEGTRDAEDRGADFHRSDQEVRASLPPHLFGQSSVTRPPRSAREAGARGQ